MTVIVRDNGFHPDDLFGAPLTAFDELEPGTKVLDLPNDAAVEALADHLATLQVIRISFPSFADGRGFSLAKRLRNLGFAGRLRAAGHVISDQYGKARRAGFDEVEISDDLAMRQPQHHWLQRANWDDTTYQDRLRAAH